jgi:proteasome accessory factor B
MCGRSDEPGQYTRTRPNIERQIEIHEMIRAGEFPNCTTLAAHFNISEETVRRDINFMIERMQLPIDYDPQRHGYKFTKEVGNFSGVTVSEQELFQWGIVRRVLQQDGSHLSPALGALLDKVTRLLSPNAKYSFENINDIISFRPFGMEKVNHEKHQLISRAIDRERAIACNYRNHGQKKGYPCVLYPYHMTYANNRWYVLAGTPTRAKAFKYVLSRIDNPVMTKEKFKRPADFNPDKVFKECFRAMGGDKEYKIVIDFDRWGTDEVIDQLWHQTQEFVRNPDGTSRLTMTINSLEEIEGWILSFRKHAKVVTPVELIARVRNSSREVDGLYESPKVAEPVATQAVVSPVSQMPPQTAA